MPDDDYVHSKDLLEQNKEKRYQGYIFFSLSILFFWLKLMN